MVTFYFHIIQYVSAPILGIIIVIILQICNNNLYFLWSRYLSHTQPFLDKDPRPPACHMIMPQQTFTSFMSSVTRHPSWPRLISQYLCKATILCHLHGKESNPGLDSYLALLLWPYFKSLASFPRSSPTLLRIASLSQPSL